ncbi:MAG TPA: HAD-IA family hydrolase [Acidimicrobiales bacterium]
MIRATLWDFGGVLSSSPFEAFAAYERDHGLPEGFIRRLNATNHHDNAWAHLERGDIGFDEFCRRFEAEARDAGGVLDARGVMELLSGSVRPAMVEAVRRCHERLKTGLLTNNFVTEERETANHSDVFELFDVIIESSKAGVRKPDPRFYRMACDALGIEPSEAVFLDDLGINLKPAREMGMTTIKVVDPSSALAELESVLGFSLG